MPLRTMCEGGKKHLSGFSIDSIIGKDTERRKTPSPSRSPSEPDTRGISPSRTERGTQDRREDAKQREIEKELFTSSKHFQRISHHHRHPVVPAHLSPFGPHLLKQWQLAERASVDFHTLTSLGLINPHGAAGHFLHPLHPPGIAHHTPSSTHLSFPSALLGVHRDSYQTLPWLVPRHEGFFGPRFGGPDAGLLLHHFRKPKRIRTAFSPSQLLRLEQAFDRNHYVVGQERKDLAAKLNLTETQVKVWFQNRRTKHKRIKAEEEDGSKSPGCSVDHVSSGRPENSVKDDVDARWHQNYEEDIECRDNREEDIEMDESNADSDDQTLDDV